MNIRAIIYLIAVLSIVMAVPCNIVELSSLADPDDCFISRVDDYTISWTVRLTFRDDV